MRFQVFYYSARTGHRQEDCDLDVSQRYVDHHAASPGRFAHVIDSDGGSYWLDGQGNVVGEPAVVRDYRNRNTKPLTPR